MDNELTFKEMKKALELATRIDELRKYIHKKKQDLTYHDTALYTCRTEDAKEYASLDTLGTLFYWLSQDLDTRINPDALLSKIKDLI